MKHANDDVWLALDSARPGGIESHVLQLARGLRQHGQRVRVIFLRDHGPHPLRQALQAQSIACTVLDGSPFALVHSLRRARPALLHTHGYKAGILGRLSARALDIPVVSTYHAGEPGRGLLRAYDWLDRNSSGLADAALAVSHAVAARLPRSCHVLDNFVDVASLASRAASLPCKACEQGAAKDRAQSGQVAFVGRLSEEKGPDLLLRVAQLAPRTEFHVYGDGPLASPLRRAAAVNVCFHGQQASMDAVWPRIGLLVMPSRFEGLPMAALEAMARGVPVLAFDVGALDQLIDNGRNGWRVAGGDVQQMAKRLGEWCTLAPHARRQMGRAARARIEGRFSADVVVPRLIALYAEAARTSPL